MAPRPAGQEGKDQRSVFCDRPAEQNSPQHAGAPHFPPRQVEVGFIFFYANPSSTAYFNTCFLPLGSPCKRRRTECRPTRWRSCLRRASCAVRTPSILCRASRTSARPQRKMPPERVLKLCLGRWFANSTIFCFVSFFRCVELIICEQMNKYRVRLKDISSLEFAESKAKCRLTLIRRSMVSSSTSSCR